MNRLFGLKSNVVHPVNKRGYHLLYRDGKENRCPGCGRSHWHVGRLMAECAFCATALPLEASTGIGPGLFRHGGKLYVIGEAA